jgi:hypothetical protein
MHRAAALAIEREGALRRWADYSYILHLIVRHGDAWCSARRHGAVLLSIVALVIALVN